MVGFILNDEGQLFMAKHHRLYFSEADGMEDMCDSEGDMFSEDLSEELRDSDNWGTKPWLDDIQLTQAIISIEYLDAVVTMRDEVVDQLTLVDIDFETRKVGVNNDATV
jgi:hypothetical protein